VSGFDWAALGAEAIDLLRRYVRIDTTNPPGDESAGVEFLAAFLAKEGIPAGVIHEGELFRIHGSDEHISLENVRAELRAYTELLLAVLAPEGS
jgi:acetylornithine deacetylase/succinyl-diaminopimelate desuccinylase-like protein